MRCRYRNTGDLAVFQEFQQALLLLLVEILYLIQVQQDTVGGHHGVHIRHDILHILEGCGGCVEGVQRLFRLPGDNVGHGGLSGAGGTVENEVGIGAVLDQAAQQRPLAQQVLLSGHVVKRLGPYLVCQRTHSGTASLLWKIL